MNSVVRPSSASAAVTTSRRRTSPCGSASATISKIGDSYEQARAHNGLARAYDAASDRGRARSHWRKALAIYTSLGAPETAEIRERLAN
ncbi:MAG: hypothetical protein ABSA93_29340 [Streptosporangiaceae bacterium]